MSESGQISIKELRDYADRGAGGRLGDGDYLLALVEAVEALREIHEMNCGCDQPGSWAKCIYPPEEMAALSRFLFDTHTPRSS